MLTLLFYSLVILGLYLKTWHGSCHWGRVSGPFHGWSVEVSWWRSSLLLIGVNLSIERGWIWWGLMGSISWSSWSWCCIVQAFCTPAWIFKASKRRVLRSTFSPTVGLVTLLAKLLDLLQPRPQQLHLLITVIILLPQVLVLLLQLPQFVGHPVLDPGSLGLHLFSISQPLLALKMKINETPEILDIRHSLRACKQQL